MGTFGPKLAAIGVAVHALEGTPRSLVWALPQLARRVQPRLIQGWMYHGNLAATVCGRCTVRQGSVLWNIRQSLADLRHEKYGTAAVIRLCALLSRKPRKISYTSQTAERNHKALGFSGA